MSQIPQWPLHKAGSVAASMRAPHIRASHFANASPRHTSPPSFSTLKSNSLHATAYGLNAISPESATNNHSGSKQEKSN